VAGLVPGKYTVAVMANSTAGRNVDIPTTFAPSSIDVGGASVFQLSGGEIREGLDIQVTLSTSYALSGRVIDGGSAIGRVRKVRLTRSTALGTTVAFEAREVSADPSGRFAFRNVTAGIYSVSVVDAPLDHEALRSARLLSSRSTLPVDNATVAQDIAKMARADAIIASVVKSIGNRSDTEQTPLAPVLPAVYATALVAVDDHDVGNVELVLRHAATISGRVVFHGNASKPTGPALLATPVYLFSADGIDRIQARVSGIGADGRFSTVGVLPGRYDVALMRAFDGWYLASITRNGQDVATEGIELGDSDVTDVIITYVDTPSSIEGSVIGDDGASVSAAFVYVFPTDRRAWTNAGVDSVQEIRTDEGGRYHVALRPGKYYLVSTERPLERWRSVEDLNRLVPRAEEATVAAGEAVVKRLRIKKAQSY
jgi:hypothetical protein